jgi:DNA-binding transcriptional ArsR family regulator
VNLSTDKRTGDVAVNQAIADPCARKHGGSETSVAAHRTSAVHAESDRLEILQLLHDRSNGLTCDEYAELTNRPPNAVSGRFSELRDKGAIVDSGERRRTRALCSAKVWKLAPPLPPEGHLF